jgi:hypothetical protein
MYAFSFKHELLLHKAGLPLAPHRASVAIKIENGSFKSGADYVGGELRGKANQDNFIRSNASGA